MVNKKSKKLGVEDNSTVTVAPTMEAQIQALADKNGIEVQVLADEYTKQYQDLSTKGVNANIERLAFNGVCNLVRKMTKPKTEAFAPKQKAEQVVGFIIADSQIFDRVEMMVGMAKRFAAKNGMDKAEKAHLINKAGEPIDTREQVFGKLNTEFGKPLGHRDADGNFIYNHERSRTLDMIAKLRGSDWKLGTIQTNDNKLSRAWDKVKLYSLASIFGIVKEDNPKPLTEEQKASMSEEEQVEYLKNADHSFKLNSSNAEDTVSIFHKVNEDVDVDAIFMQVVGSKLTEISAIEREYELLPKGAKGKPLWDHRFYVKGTVSWIRREPSPIGDYSLGIWNPETGAEIVVNFRCNADFGENSEIIVISKLEKGDLRIEGENGQAQYVKGEGAVRLSALGFYKIPNCTTPAETATPEALDDESGINGWVE